MGVRLTFEDVQSDWRSGFDAGSDPVSLCSVPARTRFCSLDRREWLLFAIACGRHLPASPQLDIVLSAIEDFAERRGVGSSSRVIRNARADLAKSGSYSVAALPGLYDAEALALYCQDRTYRQAVRSACAGFAGTVVMCGWSPHLYHLAPVSPFARYEVACVQATALAHAVSPGWAFKPAWATEAVSALAAVMYKSGDFTPAPILADALQEAGCGGTKVEQVQILDYLRGGDAKFRGCRVLDEILGKRKKR